MYQHSEQLPIRVNSHHSWLTPGKPAINICHISVMLLLLNQTVVPLRWWSQRHTRAAAAWHGSRVLILFGSPQAGMFAGIRAQEVQVRKGHFRLGVPCRRFQTRLIARSLAGQWALLRAMADQGRHSMQQHLLSCMSSPPGLLMTLIRCPSIFSLIIAH